MCQTNEGFLDWRLRQWLSPAMPGARRPGTQSITTSWECDSEIVDDIVTVFSYAARHSIYPDRLGYEKQFEAVVEAWRPELTEREA